MNTTETTTDAKPADKPSIEKKLASPEPILSVAVDGALYAAAIDRYNLNVFVGGSSGTMYYLSLMATQPRLVPRGHESSYIGAMAITGLSTAREQIVVGRYDGSITWYDWHETRKRHAVAAHEGWITDLEIVSGDIAPDGELVVSVGHDMLVKTWDARTGALKQTFAGHAAETPEGYLSALYALAASPTDSIIASGDRAGVVKLWDLRTGREAGRLGCGEFYTFDAEKRDRSIGGVRRVRFSPDGTKLAVAGIGAVSNVDGFVGPCRIEIWDWRAGKRLAVLQDSHKAVLNDVRWTADGKHLVAGGGGDAGGLLIVWRADAATDPKPVQKIKLKGHPHRLHFTAGDRSLVVVGFEAVQVWDTAALIPVETKAEAGGKGNDGRN